ncbi:MULTISPECIES: orotidine-5'-phosphate decarboxylase [Thermodesulfovibrio]|jgi:orotidine-5'-phosphate decarboxylase|uniref:Orotidine 5'-phosphate decarboxylase n=1 Tax=Thermodesulfovibrio obliviosus TaxID=3118332 RepID=A0AAU8H2K1_9BACT
MIDPSRIIVALDFSKKEDALRIVDQLEGVINFYKVGLELFLSEGHEILKILKNKGKKIFLDLKFHDIPNTVYKAVQSVLQYEIDMLTVHALGGTEMMKKAALAVKEYSYKENIPPPKILAVTVLTSLDEKDLVEALSFPISRESLVKNLALKAKQVELDGVVSAVSSVKTIKQVCGQGFIVVTPGIRLKNSNFHDQKVVATAHEAFSEGADYIVIGRAITHSNFPQRMIVDMINS